MVEAIRMIEPRPPILDRLKEQFRKTGYTGGLLQEDYSFALVLESGMTVASIPLAAFAQEPPSYRNACFGVAIADGTRGVPLVEQYRSLGAPQIFEIREDQIVRWKMTSKGDPELVDQVHVDSVAALFREHRSEWEPSRLLNIKTARELDARQLDFFDIGLLPLINQEVRLKLDRLLREIVNLALETLQRRGALKPDTHSQLFRLLFRLLAAKVLADRGHPGHWLDPDPGRTIAEVDAFYFREGESHPSLDDPEVQAVVWNRIRDAFHFENLSGDALAYVYENTLVTPEARRSLGIHGTPPEIAEYLTRHLPIEELAPEERRVFEPFSGHAVFLVAAMQRLRDLLPAKMSAEERHRYFVRMISGLELDGFAREVAVLSLMLADYPNPDGWRLYAGDAFESPVLDQELKAANVVLSNPPFEDFSKEERDRHSRITSVHKPAELLRRVLLAAPEMVGLVLPRVFVHGRAYEQIRRELLEKYAFLEVLALPDGAFQHSEADVVLVLAHGVGNGVSRLVVGDVYEHDLQDFYLTHRPSYRAEVEVGRDASQSSPRQIWIGPLDEVWRATSVLARLGQIADIHRGVEFRVPFVEHREELISRKPLPGFRQAVHRVEESLEPFLITGRAYLNMAPAVQRGHAYQLPWDKPKLIVNAVRRTRGRWKITAAADSEGLVCYQNFHGVWPRSGLRLEALTAILNGPVANAFVSTREAQRGIRIQTLKGVPIPALTSEQEDTLVALVRDYVKMRVEWLNEESPPGEASEACRGLLMEIDGEVLRAYDLPPRLERAVLDYFRGQQRPVPLPFQEYFPASFKPYLPWHRYISRDMESATARSTLRRLPIISDPAISQALSAMD